MIDRNNGRSGKAGKYADALMYCLFEGSTTEFWVALVILGTLVAAVWAWAETFHLLAELISKQVVDYAHAAYVIARDARDRFPEPQEKSTSEEPA